MADQSIAVDTLNLEYLLRDYASVMHNINSPLDRRPDEEEYSDAI